MSDKIEWLKKQLKCATYVIIDRGEEGHDVKDDILDLIAEVERLRPKNRVYPCGCVTCICEDEIKCHGCGAVGCGQPGMPAEHTPGAQPMSIPKLRAEVERLTKRCEEARHVIAVLLHAWKTDNRPLASIVMKGGSWLEGKP